MAEASIWVVRVRVYSCFGIAGEGIYEVTAWVLGSETMQYGGLVRAVYLSADVLNRKRSRHSIETHMQQKLEWTTKELLKDRRRGYSLCWSISTAGVP